MKLEKSDIRLLADENLDNDILRGLSRRKGDLDVIRVQDVGLRGASDPHVLDWAASESRILVTHDVRTIPKYADDRLSHGMKMPGVIIILKTMPIGQAIDDLVLIATCSRMSDWESQILFLPL